MKLLFRNATADDLPAITSLHAEQEAQNQTDYELPNLFGNQIKLVVVGCDEKDAIRQCFYVEAVAELRFIGCDPKATALSRREVRGLSYVLKQMGFRYLEVFVPRKLKHMIRKPLLRAGFEDKDSELSYFSKDLRGSK